MVASCLDCGLIKAWMEMRSTNAWIWTTWTRGRSSPCRTSSSWWSHRTAWRLSPHADARELWTQTTASRKCNGTFYTYDQPIRLWNVSKIALRLQVNALYLMSPSCDEDAADEWHNCCSLLSQKHRGELLRSQTPHRLPARPGLEVDPWAQWLRC